MGSNNITVVFIMQMFQQVIILHTNYQCYICGLFNDTVNILDYITLYNWDN
jgi:hypothetical protein